MVQSIDDARRRQRSGASRTPPHDLQAEESLLGAMLLSRDAVAVALEQCTAADFYKPAHGHVFEAIGALYGRGEPVDPVTAADELRRSGLLDTIGGPSVLIGLQATTPATSNAGRYARIVSDHALLRRLISVANEISDMGYDVPENVDAAIDQAESMVFDVGQRRVAETMSPIRDLLSHALDRLEALYDRGEAITGVPTGYTDLDEQLSGLQPSNLVIVGARPAAGKALALDTPLPTPSGWTSMGAVRVGDLVLDEHGRPCRVEYTSPIFLHHRCFRLTFDDGSSIVADAGHRWLADEACGDLPRVVTTEEMVARGVNRERQPRWYLPVAGAIDLPEVDLPTDPYVLGCRLGEAGSGSIPPAYLRGSAKHRLDLLQGIMDTAGTLHTSGRAELVLVDRALTDQAWELVCSLGQRPFPITGRGTPGPSGSWGFSWTPRDPVFRSSEATERQLRLLGAVRDGLPLRRAVTAIEEVPTVPVRCISVSSDSHLFLAGRAMVPTHNTSFALGIAAHAAMEARKPVLFFSLEMSHLELTQRLLCAEARVDSSRMRNGKLQDSDWSKISHAIGRLGEAPIFIDDNPNLTVMDIRAKARRLKSREDLSLVVVDYLQLMTGRTSAENRQVEVSEISRGLKILARELDVPVIALSQLSRNLEQRADKRPMLADLRESGCMPADTRVLRADTGAETTMGELLLSGEVDIPVWSIDQDLKMTPAVMTHVFPTGIKEVFELTLRSGRTVKASANHPFLTVDGWARLDELTAGHRIAVPRRVPEPINPMRMADAEVILLAHMLGDGCMVARQPLHYTSADEENLRAVEEAASHFGITPRRVQQRTWAHVYLPAPYRLTHGKRNPVAKWLDHLGVYGLHSWEKFIPKAVFRLPNDQLALFIRHLWSTDGSVGAGCRRQIYYSSTSRQLIDDLQQLLLRFEVQTHIHTTRKPGYRLSYQLTVKATENEERFIRLIGVHGRRGEQLELLEGAVSKHKYTDSIPFAVWERVLTLVHQRQSSMQRLQRQIGSRSQIGRAAPSREVLRRVGLALADENLLRLADSEVSWDEIVSIRSVGEEPVFDATVRETHNFTANGIVSENSLEQDADVVIFIYRDEVYNPESPDRGTAEILVAKHRNGPTGTARLAFLDHYARFANMARGM